MRKDFDSDLKLPWQIELGLGGAAIFLSGLTLLVISGLIQYAINHALEAVATATHQEAGPAYLSIGSFWPVLLTLFAVLFFSLYCTFRRRYINLLCGLRTSV